MKKVLSLLMLAVLLMAALASCRQHEGDVKSTISENYAIITLDDFSGKHTFKVERAVQGEGMVYYQVSLTAGTLTASFYENSIIGNQPLFTVDAGDTVNGSTGYLERNGEIEFAIEADSSVSGEIIVAFSEDVLKAVYNGNLQLHEHTREMRSNEYAHWYVYTCGCETPDNSAKHIDVDENFICDGCDYIMPGHKHTYEYYHDDMAHGWTYTCGCKTPPNMAQHFDGNGDGRCDENSCEYVMISYSIAYDFTMPDENVTITYEITDGFLPG